MYEIHNLESGHSLNKTQLWYDPNLVSRMQFLTLNNSRNLVSYLGIDEAYCCLLRGYRPSKVGTITQNQTFWNQKEPPL